MVQNGDECNFTIYKKKVKKLIKKYKKVFKPKIILDYFIER